MESVTKKSTIFHRIINNELTKRERCLGPILFFAIIACFGKKYLFMALKYTLGMSIWCYIIKFLVKYGGPL